jgi:hypothetical protein
MPKNWPAVSKDHKDDPFLWAAETGKAEIMGFLHSGRLLCHKIVITFTKIITLSETGDPEMRAFWLILLLVNRNLG